MFVMGQPLSREPYQKPKQSTVSEYLIRIGQKARSTIARDNKE
jgi:hypothetical protein